MAAEGVSARASIAFCGDGMGFRGGIGLRGRVWCWGGSGVGGRGGFRGGVGFMKREQCLGEGVWMGRGRYR